MTQLARLGDDALMYHPIGSRFEAIAAETLGNAGTDGDGFNDLINPVISQFGIDGETASTLDPSIAAAEFVDGNFGATYHAPIVPLIADFTADGDSMVGDSATAVTPAPPAPPPAPAPAPAPAPEPTGPSGGNAGSVATPVGFVDPQTGEAGFDFGSQQPTGGGPDRVL